MARNISGQVRYIENEVLTEEELLDETREGFRGGNDLEYLLSGLRSFPLLNDKQERDLAREIFDGKINLLCQLAITNPIFPIYLEEIVLTSEPVIDNEEDVFEEDESSHGTFKNYFNSWADYTGNEKDYDKIKKLLTAIIRFSRRIQLEKDKRKRSLQEMRLRSLITEVDFSWTRLRKDRILEAFELSDPLLRRLKKDMAYMTGCNLRLSMSIAKQFFRHNANYADLVQEANRGLMTAVERFDYRRGNKFSTYSHNWIKQHVSRFASQYWMIRVPAYIWEKFHALRQVENHHPDWSDEELAQKLGYSTKYLQELRAFSRNMQTVSLDIPLRKEGSSDKDTPLSSVIADDVPSVETNVMEVMVSEEIIKKMKDRLSAREYNILIRRLGLAGYSEESLERIGSSYGLSRERIRQLEQKALRKLSTVPFFRELHNSVRRKK